jgi:predicted AlkP superfamily phosphohydrolase/phosphomutase
VGPYKTVGWDHDTSGLNAERMDEAAFLSDVAMVEDQREKMLLRAMDAKDWDLLIAVSTATDRVAHMFYRLLDPKSPRYDAKLAARYGNAIEKSYTRMDRVVGEVVRKLPEGATLIVLSDHGFHDFRRGLHTNSWLVRNGYMALHPSDESPDGRFSTKDFFPAVDWSRTKAYALGTGQVYLNLEGRERDRIVKPDAGQVAGRSAKLGAFAIRRREQPLPGRSTSGARSSGARPEMPISARSATDGAHPGRRCWARRRTRSRR